MRSIQAPELLKQYGTRRNVRFSHDDRGTIVVDTGGGRLLLSVGTIDRDAGPSCRRVRGVLSRNRRLLLVLLRVLTRIRVSRRCLIEFSRGGAGNIERATCGLLRLTVRAIDCVAGMSVLKDGCCSDSLRVCVWQFCHSVRCSRGCHGRVAGCYRVLARLGFGLVGRPRCGWQRSRLSSRISSRMVRWRDDWSWRDFMCIVATRGCRFRRAALYLVWYSRRICDGCSR